MFLQDKKNKIKILSIFIIASFLVSFFSETFGSVSTTYNGKTYNIPSGQLKVGEPFKGSDGNYYQTVRSSYGEQGNIDETFRLNTDGTVTDMGNTPVTKADGSVTNVNSVQNGIGGAAPTDTAGIGACVDFTGGFPTGINWGNCFAQILYYILSFFGVFMGIVGSFFNLVFDITVVHMKDMLTNIKVISTGWTAVRDMANILFIFMLLYLAIATILQLDEHGVKHGLSRLIIGATLINFSLFFVKIPIDVSNILAIEIYNKITVTGTAVSGGSSSGLGDAIMSMFSPQMVFSDPNLKLSTTATPTSSEWNLKKNPTTTFAMGIIIIFTAIFVFLAVIIIFIKRFITLVLLMIFSPLAFAGMAIPNHNIEHEISSKFWGVLLKESFYAPVFMFMMYLTVTIGQALNATDLGKTFDLAWATSVPVGNIISYSVVLGMMIFSLTVSEMMGVKGASGAIKFFDSARGATTGWVGANTIGRLSSTVLNKGNSATALREAAAGRRGNNPLSKFMYQQGARAVISATGNIASNKFGGTQSYDDKVHNREEEFKALMEEHHNDPKIRANLLIQGAGDILGNDGTDRKASDIMHHHMSAEEHADSKIELENMVKKSEIELKNKENGLKFDQSIIDIGAKSKVALGRYYTEGHAGTGRLDKEKSEKVDRIIEGGRPAHKESVVGFDHHTKEYFKKYDKEAWSNMSNGQRKSILENLSDKETAVLSHEDIKEMLDITKIKDKNAVESLVKNGKANKKIQENAINSAVNSATKVAYAAIFKEAKDAAEKNKVKEEYENEFGKDDLETYANDSDELRSDKSMAELYEKNLNRYATPNKKQNAVIEMAKKLKAAAQEAKEVEKLKKATTEQATEVIKTVGTILGKSTS